LCPANFYIRSMTSELLPTIEEARRRASARADRAGSPFCIVSGRRDGVTMYRVLAVEGFGLPPGAVMEEVVEPARESEEREPPEKISSNGF